jgi:hypothetical protein
MIQNILSEIGGVGIYGVISGCLFFLVFGGILLRACLLRKSYLDSMSSLPLQDDEPAAPTKGENRHECE